MSSTRRWSESWGYCCEYEWTAANTSLSVALRQDSGLPAMCVCMMLKFRSSHVQGQAEVRNSMCYAACVRCAGHEVVWTLAAALYVRLTRAEIAVYRRQLGPCGLAWDCQRCFGQICGNHNQAVALRGLLEDPGLHAEGQHGVQRQHC